MLGFISILIKSTKLKGADFTMSSNGYAFPEVLLSTQEAAGGTGREKPGTRVSLAGN